MPTYTENNNVYQTGGPTIPPEVFARLLAAHNAGAGNAVQGQVDALTQALGGANPNYDPALLNQMAQVSSAVDAGQAANTAAAPLSADGTANANFDPMTWNPLGSTTAGAADPSATAESVFGSALNDPSFIAQYILGTDKPLQQQLSDLSGPKPGPTLNDALATSLSLVAPFMPGAFAPGLASALGVPSNVARALVSAGTGATSGFLRGGGSGALLGGAVGGLGSLASGPISNALHSLLSGSGQIGADAAASAAGGGVELPGANLSEVVVSPAAGSLLGDTAASAAGSFANEFAGPKPAPAGPTVDPVEVIGTPPPSFDIAGDLGNLSTSGFNWDKISSGGSPAPAQQQKGGGPPVGLISDILKAVGGLFGGGGGGGGVVNTAPSKPSSPPPPSNLGNPTGSGTPSSPNDINPTNVGPGAKGPDGFSGGGGTSGLITNIGGGAGTGSGVGPAGPGQADVRGSTAPDVYPWAIASSNGGGL